MTPPLYVLTGNLVRFFFVFKDIDDVLTDPTDVTAEVGTSDLDAVTLTPVHDSTGKYHADWDTTGIPSGTYYCKASGTGALLVSREISLKITVPHLSG